MSFRAKKLRVQLPCSVEGSLVEFADDRPPDPDPPPVFNPCTPGFQTTGARVCIDFHPHFQTTIALVVTSPQCPGPAPCIVNVLDSAPCLAGSADRILPAEQSYVDPDFLPLLKKQLENRLAEMQMAADVAKKRIEARLDDIAVAEQALRRRQDQEPDQ